MSGGDPVDERLRGWLTGQVPQKMPPGMVQRAMTETASVSQRSKAASWRTPLLRALPVAVVVTLGVLLVGVLLARPPGDPNVGDTSPSATSTASPSSTLPPTPTPVPSVAVGPGTCVNPDDGYGITVPDGWWYDRRCQFLDPEQFSMASLEPARVTAIRIVKVPTDIGTFDTVLSREEVIVADRPAVVWEIEATSEGGLYPVGTHVYEYVVQLGPTPEDGPNLILMTDSTHAADFDAAKMTLDEIAASLTVD